VTAVRADEPVRPAQPVQVVQAVRVRGEPRPQLTDRPRIVHTTTRTVLHHTIQTSPVR
jgi:hypothetical protein